MPLILKADLVCDVCGNTAKGSLTVNSPVDWVVKSPDDWIVEHKVEDEDSYINISCCDDCNLQLHATAKA